MSYIVGLTGGIGSGKSTIAEMFQALNVPIVDADIVARQVVAKGSETLQKIQAHFGDTVLNENGELNRAQLRQIIFHQAHEKQWLNQLLHPAIRQEMLRQTAQIDAPYLLWVVPLLLENKLDAFCDRVLVIDVEPAVQQARVIARDKSSPDTVKNIINAQVDRTTRLKSAHDIIENSLPFAENHAKLQQQVLALHQHYLHLADLKGKQNVHSDC